MPWTWARPRDADLLAARPLLDLGTGDGQTLAALTSPDGVVVGMDRSLEVLRAARRSLDRPLLAADVGRLPIRDGTVGVVLAADLLHHQDGEALGRVLGEAHRALTAGGRLVAWWYGEPGRAAPDAPRFPRGFGEVARAVRAAGFADVRELALELSGPGPPTVGLVAEA